MTEVGKVTGIGPALATSLAAAGFATAEALAAATPERVSVIPGIGRQRATRLIAAAKALLGQGEAPATPPRPLPVREARVRKVKPVRVAAAAVTPAAPEAEVSAPEAAAAKKLSPAARKAARAAKRAAKESDAAMKFAEKLRVRAARKAAKAEALANAPAPEKPAKPAKKKAKKKS